MLNLALIGRNLRRLAGGRPAGLRDLAAETWEIWPSEEVPGRPALFPEGALERIRGLSPWRNPETEQALIRGDPVRHAATRAHLVRDAVLAGAYVYCGVAKERVGHGALRYLDPALGSRIRLDEAHLVSTWTGADFFGNFLCDSLTLEMIPPPGSLAIGAPGKPYRHEDGYRQILGLPRPRMPGHARIGRLVVYSDHGQNGYKRRRYDELRSRLRRTGAAPAAAPGIFLRRGTDGEPRHLVNEADLAERLALRGFDILDPSRLEPAEIVRRSLDARVVVSVEGSHLSHAVYTLAGSGAWLVIQPPDRFALPYKEFADCLGMAFGFVVAEPAGAGFRVNLDEIEGMLDRLS
ncbi:MAG: glycosyltransferase family 61 protein [Rhodobacteraceae bacterium]|nr:glycosyltransferase family 61 protein [Paracoccaceae bacterium]